MGELATRSAVVACPGCEEPLLVEASVESAAVEVACWNCDRRMTVPVSTLTPDVKVV